jgi:hypothetical protein
VIINRSAAWRAAQGLRALSPQACRHTPSPVEPSEAHAEVYAASAGGVTTFQTCVSGGAPAQSAFHFPEQENEVLFCLLATEARSRRCPCSSRCGPQAHRSFRPRSCSPRCQPQTLRCLKNSPKAKGRRLRAAGPCRRKIKTHLRSNSPPRVEYPRRP